MDDDVRAVHGLGHPCVADVELVWLQLAGCVFGEPARMPDVDRDDAVDPVVVEQSPSERPGVEAGRAGDRNRDQR